MKPDQEGITETGKKTVLPGSHLLAWEKVREYMTKKGFVINPEDYLIIFDEDDNSYFISFIKPRKKPLPGGGGARAEVRKSDMRVFEFRFAR